MINYSNPFSTSGERHFKSHLLSFIRTEIDLVFWHDSLFRCWHKFTCLCGVSLYSLFEREYQVLHSCVISYCLSMWKVKKPDVLLSKALNTSRSLPCSVSYFSIHGVKLCFLKNFLKYKQILLNTEKSTQNKVKMRVVPVSRNRERG